MNAPSAAATAFDALASGYDATFTNTRLGRELRARVWARLTASFQSGERILELNCGTGEDALHLARQGIRVTATDGSAAMLGEARRKAATRGAGDAVRFAQLDLSRPDISFAKGRRFDGAFSSFGGLNCVGDLAPLARCLERCLTPGARLVLVVMGPLCLWEILASLFRAAPRRAFRRLARDAAARVGDATVPVYYPWPSETARALGSRFAVTRVEGLGVALPPSLWSGTMEERPRLLRALRRADRTLCRLWPFRYLGDHYILELTWSGHGD